MSALKVTLQNNREMEINFKQEGKVELLLLPICITVEEGSFLHIGTAPSPLTEKKGAIFKVDRIPVIPATSFKGALRNQLESLLIEKLTELKESLKLDNDNILKPCIPAPRPTKAEKELINSGTYRGSHCEIRSDEKKIEVGDLGICPVCYFMGATGIMGFLRFTNFYAEKGDWLIDQTNIRIDRKTGTSATRAKIDGEQVKPGTVFKGTIEIINKTPQGFEFGLPRVIGNKSLDKWLEKWDLSGFEKRKRFLIEQILIPAIQNVRLLGGQKSKGAGKVNISFCGDQ